MAHHHLHRHPDSDILEKNSGETFSHARERANTVNRQAMNLSLAASVLMLVGKMTAYFITNSTAILSDAAESVIHIAATAIAALGLWYASRPADREHLYGHGRILLFSIGLEGGLIFTAAIYIIAEAMQSLIHGSQLQSLDLGLTITASLGVVNLLLGLHLVRVGKRTNAKALIANGQHVLSDMWTSFAVVFGVLAIKLTGYTWIDPAMAICAGLFILYTGSSLIRNAFIEAMDQAIVGGTEKMQETLKALIDAGTISGFHQLRHRQVNDGVWIELHILVPGQLTVAEAHERVTLAEKALTDLFPTSCVIVTSHIEPAEHDLAHPEGHIDHPL